MVALHLRILDRKYDSLFAPTLLKFRKIGFDYMSFGVIEADMSTLSYFSHPEWAEYYKNNALTLHDPCINFLMNTDRCLALWSATPRAHHKVDVMIARKKMCGIEDGISLYYRYSSGVKHIIGLGTHRQEALTQFLLHPPMYELEEALISFRKSFDKVRHPESEGYSGIADAK